MKSSYLSSERPGSCTNPKTSASRKVDMCPGITRTEQPFSLILPKNQVCEMLSAEKENKIERSYEVLRPGMILLKNYLSLSDQVEIINICEELGSGPVGFSQPGYRDGRKLQLQMMCLGRYWDPHTKYKKQGRRSKVPPVPDRLVSMVGTAIQDSQAFINSEDELPFMSPNLCIVNFYTTTGRLGLHQDLDESWDSVNKGLPVVSMSIGNSAEFMYGDKKVDKADKVVLESGDILIFGGKSRKVYHGVKHIIPNSAPEALLKQTMLQPGRLNLTFRRF